MRCRLALRPVNRSLSGRFDTVATGRYEVRLDVINLFDSVYQIRNGSGVGVFAPQSDLAAASSSD
jgi:hypothetical protein